MTLRFAICLAIASSLFLAPRLAAADTFAFDTVDAVELSGSSITVTGILSGQSSPTTRPFSVSNAAMLQQCERVALMAISKPGKYQLHIVTYTGSNYVGSCKLILRTP